MPPTLLLFNNPVRSSVSIVQVRAADPKGRCDVIEVLDKAQSLGLTVLRAWAFADGPLVWNALQARAHEWEPFSPCPLANPRAAL